MSSDDSDPEPLDSPLSTSRRQSLMAAEGARAREATGPFRLLDVPDEIWSKIGKLAVSSTPTVSINFRLPSAVSAEDGSFVRFNGSYGFQPRQPALTRVNRVLRAELLPHFYQQAIFEVAGLYVPRLEQWLVGIGKENVDLIRALRIQLPFANDTPERRILRQFGKLDQGLEDFRMEILPEGQVSGAGFVVMRRSRIV